MLPKLPSLTIDKLPRRVLSLAGKVHRRLSTKGERPIPRAPVITESRCLRRFRAYLAAEELSSILSQSGAQGKRLLDIGGGHGIHAAFFAERHPDLKIDVLDLEPGPLPLVHTGPYDTFETQQPYDVIWASHLVEHLRNPGLFFDQAYRQLAVGGWLCVTVPPLRSRMTLGHVTLWNAGLLLLHLVHAGFDCRKARVATYGYNVSVLVQKTKPSKLSKRKRLPAVEQHGQYFEGNIERLNWHSEHLPELRSRAWFESASDIAPSLNRSGFFQALDDEGGKLRMHYYHAPSREHCVVA